MDSSAESASGPQSALIACFIQGSKALTSAPRAHVNGGEYRTCDVELLGDASFKKTCTNWKHWPLLPGEPRNVYLYRAKVLSKPIGWQVLDDASALALSFDDVHTDRKIREK